MVYETRLYYYSDMGRYESYIPIQVSVLLLDEGPEGRNIQDDTEEGRNLGGLCGMIPL